MCIKSSFKRQEKKIKLSKLSKWYPLNMFSIDYFANWRAKFLSMYRFVYLLFVHFTTKRSRYYDQEQKIFSSFKLRCLSRKERASKRQSFQSKHQIIKFGCPKFRQKSLYWKYIIQRLNNCIFKTIIILLLFVFVFFMWFKSEFRTRVLRKHIYLFSKTVQSR